MISLRTERGEETVLLEEFERRVREGLIAPTTLVRFTVLTGDRWVEARALELYRRLYAPARIHFTRAFSLGRFPVFTTLLCLLQIGLYLSLGGPQRVLPLDVLIGAGAKTHAHVFELGETWRLWSANLLHRDVFHLSFNMFFLFNVGGSIENAYRWQDYLLILVAAALSTTLLSAIMSDRASVGASGVVLGLFGAASVFGYKYAEILPARYRRYFGGAVLPYAMFIVYIGLVSENTDNWGHFGGLAGGMIAALPLEPRLLRVGPTRRAQPRDWVSFAVAVVTVVAVLASGPAIRAAGVPMRVVTTPDVGLRYVVPTRWRADRADHLGYRGWANELGVRVTAEHEQSEVGPVDLGALRRRFVGTELRRRELEGDVADLRVIRERPLLIPGGRAVVLDIALESRAGPLMTRNLLIERGYYSYKIVMSAPVMWFSAYEPLFDRVIDQVRLVKTDALTRAEQVVSTFSGMSSAHVELGDELARLGSADEAAKLYARALEALPEFAPAQLGLARLAVDYGRDLDDAEGRAAELHRRFPADVTYAALLADIRQRLGQMSAACAVLQDTLDRTAEPADSLRARLRRLRCRSGGWLDQ